MRYLDGHGQRRAEERRHRSQARAGVVREDLPPVVFKITSYCHSAGAVWQRVKAMTRAGELEAEGPNGELLDQGQLKEMVKDWDAETASRARRQYAMRAVVSFPPGVDEEKATEAARQFFRAAFADNHDYVVAPSSDTENFHVHGCVQAAGHDGKQLRVRRAELQDFRLLLAETAHEQGIELEASPRRARGLPPAQRRSRAEEAILRRRGWLGYKARQ